MKSISTTCSTCAYQNHSSCIIYYITADIAGGRKLLQGASKGSRHFVQAGEWNSTLDLGRRVFWLCVYRNKVDGDSGARFNWSAMSFIMLYLCNCRYVSQACAALVLEAAIITCGFVLEAAIITCPQPLIQKWVLQKWVLTAHVSLTSLQFSPLCASHDANPLWLGFSITEMKPYHCDGIASMALEGPEVFEGLFFRDQSYHLLWTSSRDYDMLRVYYSEG